MEIKQIRNKWKGKITDRERFNNQMHFKSVDRSFNMEFGYWDDNFKLWDIFTDNGIKNNEEADIFFNFDIQRVIWGNVDIYPGFEYKVIKETETTKIFINREGLLAELPKDEHETIPHFIKSSIVTPEDWKRVKEEHFRRDDPARKVDIEALKKAHPDNRDYPLGVWSGSMIGRVRDLLTLEGLSYATYDYPDMVEDMVETYCQLEEDFLDQVLPYFNFDFAASWEDIACTNGPLVSVDFFKNVVMPRYKRIGKKLHAAGVDIWYTDCDGDIRPILPYFLEGGINCMFPFEVNSCSHPSELLNEYGKDLKIMGGVDKMELRKDKEAIKSYLETLVPLVEAGGYIPFVDHRCPPDVKPEDYLYYLDLKEKMFGL